MKLRNIKNMPTLRQLLQYRISDLKSGSSDSLVEDHKKGGSIKKNPQPPWTKTNKKE